jgi:hypothetical protein
VRVTRSRRDRRAGLPALDYESRNLAGWNGHDHRIAGCDGNLLTDGGSSATDRVGNKAEGRHAIEQNRGNIQGRLGIPGSEPNSQALPGAEDKNVHVLKTLVVHLYDRRLTLIIGISTARESTASSSDAQEKRQNNRFVLHRMTLLE